MASEIIRLTANNASGNGVFPLPNPTSAGAPSPGTLTLARTDTAAQVEAKVRAIPGYGDTLATGAVNLTGRQSAVFTLATDQNFASGGTVTVTVTGPAGTRTITAGESLADITGKISACYGAPVTVTGQSGDGRGVQTDTQGGFAG